MVFWPSFTGLVFLVAGLLFVRKRFAAVRSLDRLIVLGPVFVAAPLAAFGAEHLTSVHSIMNLVPKWMPGHLFWAYFVGLALLAAALSLDLSRYVRWAAPSLAVMFFIFVLSIHLPNVMAEPRNRILWAVMLRDLSFAAGALALAGTIAQDATSKLSKAFILIARICFAVPLIFFAVEHYLHPEFAPGVPLDLLTPAWVPLRLYLAEFVGAVLLVGGFAVLLNKSARLAATGVGFVMAVLTLLLYVPILALDKGPAQMIVGVNYVFDTLLFGGMALLLAMAMPPDEPLAKSEPAV